MNGKLINCKSPSVSTATFSDTFCIITELQKHVETLGNVSNIDGQTRDLRIERGTGLGGDQSTGWRINFCHTAAAAAFMDWTTSM